MPIRSGLAFILCWLLAFAAAASGIGAGGVAASGSTAIVSTGVPEQPAVDNTVTHIRVRATGNATWTVVVRTRLETEAEVEQYRAFQSRFRNNTSRYLGTFRERIRSIVADAERVTGREMQAVNFSASTDVQEVPRRWGVITYRFRWTNFAERPNGSAFAVGDVFEGGYYLGEDGIFAISAPDGYALDAVSPPPDERNSRTARWFGPRDFGNERPRAVFRPAEENPTTKSAVEPDATTESATESAVTTAPTTERDATTAPATDSTGTPLALLVVVVLVTVGVAAATVWRFRSGVNEAQSSVDAPAAPAPSTGDDTATVRTDAEQVEEFLRARGGRMKQAELADALDWSASKTSRVLSDLEDEGVVERVRLGRENVVDLTAGTDE